MDPVFGLDPSIFPEEIWIKILMYCDVNDICLAVTLASI
jgi:hypothetical protein